MTAAEKYSKYHFELKKMLKEFDKQLEFHKRNFRKNGSTNYGYVGDLDHYLNHIGDILVPIKEGNR